MNGLLESSMMQLVCLLLLGVCACGVVRAQNVELAPRQSSVEVFNGRPTIFIDATPYAPMVYALTDVPGGRWSWEELPQHNIVNFCERGVRLYQLDLFMDHVWPAEDRFDVAVAQRQIAGVLDVCPDASVFFRLHLRAPRWWLEQHPEEWVVYADTGYVEEQHYGLLRIIEDDNNPVRRVSMASEPWRAALTEKLEQFLAQLAETPEGGALAGIQVANGIYGEWHNWGFYHDEPDVSEPMTHAFRQWLRDRYGTDAALQDAWHDPDATFATVTAPGMEERESPDGIIRDPLRERKVIDYYECMHQVVADNIIHFAEVVKAHWPRPIITGTFYGYYFSVFGRQAAGGHLQLQRILQSPSIDYLSGPQAYGPESIALGDPYRSRSLITSVRLHGKLWLDEMDAEPTIPILRQGNYDRLLQNSVANVRRNTAFSFTKGMGLWYYDFGVAGVDLDGYDQKHKGSQGNWDHPVVMDEIERMKELFEERMVEPYQSAADVLFVYDTDSFYYTASLRGTDPVSNTLIDYNTLTAFRSGVIFDPIHVDDLDRIDLAPYRTIVFGNVYVLSEAQRAFIREQVARGGRHLVWFYAPGYVDGTTRSADAVSRLTQIHVVPTSLAKPPEIEVSLPGDATERYTLGEAPIAPLLAVDDAEAAPLGRYTETGEVAVARKELPEHTAWYVSLPNEAPQPLMHILQESGAHVYGDDGDIFYGGGGLLVLHTITGGTRHVRMRNGQQVKLDLPNGAATVILDSQTGEMLSRPHSTREGMEVQPD